MKSLSKMAEKSLIPHLRVQKKMLFTFRVDWGDNKAYFSFIFFPLYPTFWTLSKL